MKTVLAIAGRLVLAQIAALPLSFFVIIALVPALRSLEGSTGIELVGHSGPADWVIALIWAVISILISATLLVNRKQHESPPHDSTEI
jgi:hypothetical protein